MKENLTVGERIKRRREELHITQEQLADAMGYKSKSSITKIESGVSNIRQKQLKSIASILKTTPSYLMGWTDKPADDLISFIEKETSKMTVAQINDLTERVRTYVEEIKNNEKKR